MEGELEVTFVELQIGARKEKGASSALGRRDTI